MNWKREWRKLDTRIEVLVDLTHSYFSACESSGSDYHGVGNSTIIPSGKEIKEALQNYDETFQDYLPKEARSSIGQFVLNFERSNLTGIPGVGAVAVLLGILRAEMNYHLEDHNREISTLTEFSFAHLQRTLIADEEIKKKWEKAFESGETALERLGGAHLLSHRLWAFKAHGEGERTDLVVGEPIDENEFGLNSTRLVLTEWKKVTSTDYEKKAEQAYKQAFAYGKGVLGGVELENVRYLVLVSKDHISKQQVNDRVVDGITYRYVNLGLNPKTPSKL